MNVVCFHTPDEENGYLSNWYLYAFTADGVAFSSLEQDMMYSKARVFGDNQTAAQSMGTSDVARIKKFGRLVKGYNDHVWNGVRQIIVYEGLRAKFGQDDALKGRLMATGRALLAECAVRDRIWGIGLSMTDPARLDPSQWQGQNLLGYALMAVRDRL